MDLTEHALHVFHLDGLSVHYGDFPAVHGVGLDVRRNEITALIGPSGCGKSTVLTMVNVTGREEAAAGLRLSEERFRDFAKANGTTPFATMLAIYHVVLCRYTGRSDIDVTTVRASRSVRGSRGSSAASSHPSVRGF